MQEKKHPEKIKVLPELKASVTEVLVVRSRAFQPFIRTFSYVGENITKSNLGTLLGVFEIDAQGEDSAYIVNFLTSVAKKEYFNNPRRGAIESFEAALHKINLALAELVKHGNTAWLGKLHGTLGVLEKNNLHFSVTGQAKILLSRDDTIADISIGLASEESSLHPIKTFVEVSSGRLANMDQILLCSPELLALFSLDDLTKHAARMDHERFAQFLKTALVNELDMAGLMIINITEDTAPIIEHKKATKVAPTRTNNVFSQSAFLPKKPTEASSVQEELVNKQQTKEEEYIDAKTGHIYIQGETPKGQSKHPQWEQFWLGLQDTVHTLGRALSSQKKWIYKSKKQLAHGGTVIKESAQIFIKNIGRSLRRKWRKQRAATAARKAARAVAMPEQTIPLVQTENNSAITAPETTFPLETEERAPLPKTEIPTPSPITPSEPEEEFPPFLREKLALFYKHQTTDPLPTAKKPSTPNADRFVISDEHHPGFLSMLLQKCSEGTRTLWHSLRSQGKNLWQFFINILWPALKKSVLVFQNLSVSQKKIFLGGTGAVLFLTILGGYLFLKNITKYPTATPPEETMVVSTAPDSVGATSTLSTIIDNISDTIITSVVLDDQIYVITKRSILSATDNKSFTIPGNSQAKFATAMNDLRLIFISTESGGLYAWSPISKTFVENTLTLAEGARVTALGTYLTYLYILDSATDQIYRFPRADGGFGAGIPWFKDSTPVEENALMAVNETIFVTPDASTIKGFFRGRTNVTLEAPEGTFHVTALYTYPGLTNVYALDRDSKRVLIWNQDGKLMNELSNDKLGEATSLSVNEKQNEIFITTADSLLSLKMK